MIKYKIEQIGPPPMRKRGCGPAEGMKPFKYPFEQMEVYDSFLASKDERAGATACAHSYGKRHGKRFEYRAFDDGIRIWRVE